MIEYINFMWCKINFKLSLIQVSFSCIFLHRSDLTTIVKGFTAGPTPLFGVLYLQANPAESSATIFALHMFAVFLVLYRSFAGWANSAARRMIIFFHERARFFIELEYSIPRGVLNVIFVCFALKITTVFAIVALPCI